MESLNIKLDVHSSLYVKNPDTTALGHEIVTKSIELINQIGFEAFTFKKLSTEIKSTESSIYRYFKSKHALLVYLTNWYWLALDYKIALATINVEDPSTQLENALKILTNPLSAKNINTYLDLQELDKIMITESIKAYHTIHVDNENQKGFFQAYKNVVNRVADIILTINPICKYSHMIVSTVIEGAHHQHFFSDHLPKLTDSVKDKNSISDFYSHMVLKMIQ